MSTSNEISQNVVVVGDDIVDVIPYQFNYFRDANISIVVTKKNTNLTPTVYSVLTEGPDYTRYNDRIELSTRLLVGEFLLVERVVTNVQPVDYEELRPHSAFIHERQEDRTYMSLSEIKNMFKRVPMFNKFNEDEMVIEDPVDGNYLKFVYDAGTDTWSIVSDQNPVDLSDYYTKSETDSMIVQLIDDADKVDQGAIQAGVGITVTGLGTTTDPIMISSSGGVSAPEDEIVFGTGTGVTSSEDLLFFDTAIESGIKAKPMTSSYSKEIQIRGADDDSISYKAGSVSLIAGQGFRQGDVFIQGEVITLASDDGVSLNSNVISNLADPVSDDEAVNLKTLKEYINNIDPVGTIKMTMIDGFTPSGRWIPFIQTTLNRAGTYAALFAACQHLISTDADALFGPGDGTTTFTINGVPGFSPRGIGSGVINGRLKLGPDVGRKQEDQMQMITGSFKGTDDNTIAYNLRWKDATGAFTAIDDSTNYISTQNTSVTNLPGNMQFNSANSPDARASSTTLGETRSNTFGVYFWIKY